MRRVETIAHSIDARKVTAVAAEIGVCNGTVSNRIFELQNRNCDRESPGNPEFQGLFWLQGSRDMLQSLISSSACLITVH